MKAFEFEIKNTVTEAISVTQYASTIEQAIYSGIGQAIGDLAATKGKFRNEEKAVALDNNSPLQKKLSLEFAQLLEDKISTQLRVKISRAIKMPVPTEVHFQETEPGVSGLADGTMIFLTDRLSRKLSSLIVGNILARATAEYDPKTRTAGIYFVIKMATSDPLLVKQLAGNADMIISIIVSTVLHELVHVIQDYKQEGRPESEYRSYLDKGKGEFDSLHNKASLSGDEQTRYRNLYLASPQEMAAFSHEIALGIIVGRGLNKVTSVDTIPKISETDIITALSQKLRGRFRDPANPKEYAVFKRYTKLIYLELARYIDSIRDNLVQ